MTARGGTRRQKVRNEDQTASLNDRAVTFAPEHSTQDDTLTEDESGSDDGSVWDAESDAGHNGAPASETNDKTTAAVSLSLEELQSMIKEECRHRVLWPSPDWLCN